MSSPEATAPGKALLVRLLISPSQPLFMSLTVNRPSTAMSHWTAPALSACGTSSVVPHVLKNGKNRFRLGEKAKSGAFQHIQIPYYYY
jgi:hypothetical protein